MQEERRLLNVTIRTLTIFEHHLVLNSETDQGKCYGHPDHRGAYLAGVNSSRLQAVLSGHHIGEKKLGGKISWKVCHGLS